MIVMLSGKARSGKDTVFNILSEFSHTQIFTDRQIIRYAFADRLKEIAKKIFNWNGVKDEDGRFLLICIGQILRGDIRNLLRKYTGLKNIEKIVFYKKVLSDYFDFDRNIWVDTVANQIQMNYNLNEIPVITDWRFKNEYYRMAMRFGFDEIVTLRINRPESLYLDDPSETELDDFTFNYIIENNGSLEDLQQKVLEFYEEFL